MAKSHLNCKPLKVNVNAPNCQESSEKDEINILERLNEPLKLYGLYFVYEEKISLIKTFIILEN